MKRIPHITTNMTRVAALALLTVTLQAQETWIIDNNTVTLTEDDQLATNENLALGDNTTAGHLNLGTFNQTVANFFVRSKQSGSVNTVTIGEGRTLTVSGHVGIGDRRDDSFSIPDNGNRTNLTMTGGGHFVAGDGTGSDFGVWVQNNRDFTGVVDMTGLASFTANLGTGWFGVRPPFFGDATTGLNNPTPAPVIKLAPDSTINAGRIQIGGTNSGAPDNPPTLLLGTGENVLNANEITLGAVDLGDAPGSSSGWLVFQSETEGTVKIRGTGGTDTDRANLTVGSQLSEFAMAGGRSRARDFRAEFAGHHSDILLNNLVIGEDDAIGNTNFGDRSNNFVSFDQGTLDVNQVQVGRLNTTRDTADVDGYSLRSDSALNLGGGDVIVHNGVDMARFQFVREERTGVVLELNAAMNVSGGTVTVNDGAANGWAIRLASIGENAKSEDAEAIGTLNVTGGTLNVGGDIINGGVASGASGSTATAVVLNGGTLNMNGHAIGDATNQIDTLTLASGTLSNVSEINGGATVVKTGGGTLALTGTLGYTGETSVSSGNLQLDGTHTGGGLITVGSGGTLSGTGSTLSSVTIENQGILSPGNSIGDITLGDLTLNDGAIINWEFQDVSTYDRILAQDGTSMTLAGGTVTFEINGNAAGLNIGDSFMVYDGSVTGFDVNSFVIVDNSGWTNESTGHRWEISEGSLMITAIPEPSTLALSVIMLGVFAAGYARRKNR